MDVTRNPPPEAVRQSAQHVLFVEGQRDSIDREAMRTFLERLRGKEVMSSVVARCFRIKNKKGELLQGAEKNLELAKELLRRPLDEQPDDLQRLRRLIQSRVRGAPLH